MNRYEKKAEKIMLLAYDKGGTIQLDDILKEYKNDESYVSEEVARILDIYGRTVSAVMESKYGWTVYNLSDEGIEFARKGCFTGEIKRRMLNIIFLILSILAAIVTIATIF